MISQLMQVFVVFLYDSEIKPIPNVKANLIRDVKSFGCDIIIFLTCFKDIFETRMMMKYINMYTNVDNSLKKS